MRGVIDVIAYYLRWLMGEHELVAGDYLANIRVLDRRIAAIDRKRERLMNARARYAEARRLARDELRHHHG